MEADGFVQYTVLNFNAICKKIPHDLLHSITSHAELNSTNF